MFYHITNHTKCRKVLPMKFHPHWWCKNGPSQTIASMYFPRIKKSFISSDHVISLSEGDQTVVHESNPNMTNDIFIFVHGLTGSAESRCVSRLAAYFLDMGYGVVRVNLRGCGVGRHLSKEICHAGRSDDLLEMVKYFSKRYPNSRIHCMGFSMGANLLLKMACGKSNPYLDRLRSIVAISPPIDLKECVTYLGGKSSRWLDYYFVKTLIKLSTNHHKPYKLPPEKIKSLYDFDNLITAKAAGFRDADEYYKFSSSAEDLHKLVCPALIVTAQDDPCVNFSIFNEVDSHPMVSFIGTKNGGHGAFLGHTGNKKELWLEKVIHLWLESSGLLRTTQVTNHFIG